MIGEVFLQVLGFCIKLTVRLVLANLFLFSGSFSVKQKPYVLSNILFSNENVIVISPKKRAPRNAKNRGRGAEYPMDIGEEFEVDIFDVAPNGEGVAKIKNYPVFIKNAKLNDHVKIRITNLIGGAADAEIIL